MQPGDFMYDAVGAGQAVIEYLHKPVPTESQDGSSGAAAVAPGEVSCQEAPVLHHCWLLQLERVSRAWPQQQHANSLG